MNMRNISFIIVLFLVWIMGYYYYAPYRFINPTFAKEEPKEYEELPATSLEEPVVVHATDPFSPSAETEIFVAGTTIEAEAQPAPAVEVKEPVLEKKKKKSRKEKKKKNTALEEGSSTAALLPAPAQEDSYSQDLLNGATQEQDLANQTVAIASDLKKKDIGYYKMLSWHYPHIFSITVNDQTLFAKKDKVISQGDTMVIPKNKPFVIRYNYEWHTPWGKKIGAKKVAFKPNPDAEKLLVHFTSNWKNEERIVVDGADKISAEILEEEKPAVQNLY